MITPHRYLPRHLLRRVSAVAALALLCVAVVGCSSRTAPRLSHAPSYSYHQDPDARAAVEHWASVSRSADNPIAVAASNR